ncbi:RteC domain-containing protein [Pedobacter panaciterrae]|uniref:RteC domain-containing protein n=1 Tax=Pedobacter panaciterrae TaxID=363849 RepID=UPI00155DA50E|nr:RteC domain-containing protein [Pedobacter panaciterrae]NQX56811.1 RteC domain-containing protein [Pedobacter panaciterrae]
MHVGSAVIVVEINHPMNNNINPKAQQALQELKDQLKYIAQVGKNPASILQAQMKELRPVLAGLSNQYPYQDQSGEINYHKYLYPAFKSLEIYWQEYYGRNICKVAGTEKTLCKRCQQEIGFINAFFERHSFHYKYYCLEATELDSLFFTKAFGSGGGIANDSVLIPVMPGQEGVSCTLTGELFARFIAYEQLRSELLERQYALSPKPGLSNTSVDSKGKLIKPMQWTGEVIHLIELAHGIHLKEQVNNGSIGIVDFFASLGDFFGVNLGIPKKGFDNIKARKRLRKTEFTDQIREALLKKMDEEDEWGSRPSY